MFNIIDYNKLIIKSMPSFGYFNCSKYCKTSRFILFFKKLKNKIVFIKAFILSLKNIYIKMLLNTTYSLK